MFTVGVPVRDALSYVEVTVDSLRANTTCENEIIIIDDCSAEETKAYLSKCGLKVITNSEVKGFPHNCNRIIREAKYDKICLLNSDVYCPYGWNEKLALALDKFDIVGPSSCRVCGEQLIEEIECFQKSWTVDEIERFSIKNANEYGTDAMLINTVGGFCFCLNRNVIKKVGWFDEGFGLGSYEETDMCQRARDAGLRCAWIRGCYVHHYGHATFSKIDGWEKIWKDNKNKFLEKHNRKELPAESEPVKVMRPKL